MKKLEDKVISGMHLRGWAVIFYKSKSNNSNVKNRKVNRARIPKRKESEGKPRARRAIDEYGDYSGDYEGLLYDDYEYEEEPEEELGM